MTLPEYLYRMKAQNLSRVDKEYDMHLSAWLNVAAGAAKEQGKKTVPLYKTFKEFFDYERRVTEIEKPEAKKLSAKHRQMARIAAEINKKGG